MAFVASMCSVFGYEIHSEYYWGNWGFLLRFLLLLIKQLKTGLERKLDNNFIRDLEKN